MKFYVAVIVVLAAVSATTTSAMQEGQLKPFIQTMGNAIVKQLKEKNPDELIAVMREAVLTAIEAGERINKRNPELIAKTQKIAVNVVEEGTNYLAANPDLLKEGFEIAEGDKELNDAGLSVLNAVLEVVDKQ